MPPPSVQPSYPEVGTVQLSDGNLLRNLYKYVIAETGTSAQHSLQVCYNRGRQILQICCNRDREMLAVCYNTEKC